MGGSPEMSPRLSPPSYLSLHVCLLDAITSDLTVSIILGNIPFQRCIKAPDVCHPHITRRSRLFWKDQKSEVQCVLINYGATQPQCTSPITLISMEALSSMFSICSTSSYFPEWSLSAERMKRMLSTWELWMLTILRSMGWPSLYQVATGRGLPYKMVEISIKWAIHASNMSDYFSKKIMGKW